jgi:hypothetical protein
MYGYFGCVVCLVDPNAKPDLRYTLPVDCALRLVLASLLNGPDSLGDVSQLSTLPADKVAESLMYLRDRISVPRDMSVHAARLLRAHINHIITLLP